MSLVKKPSISTRPTEGMKNDEVGTSGQTTIGGMEPGSSGELEGFFSHSP